MYKGKDNRTYGELEEDILACLLIEPKLIESLEVEEKHFKHFGYMLTFFKSVYKKYQCLDINIIFSVIKGTQEMQMLDMMTYLLEVFV